MADVFKNWLVRRVRASLIGIACAVSVCAQEPAATPEPTARGVIVRFKDNVPATRRAAALAGHGVKAPEADTRSGKLHAMAAAPNAPILIESTPEDSEALAAQISRSPDILYAEPNYQIRISAAAPIRPNDFEFGKQWGLENSSGKKNADIHAPTAWARTTGSRDIVVAVIDTGIDFLHPDLAANVWVNPGEIPANGIDDDRNGYIDDVHGYDFYSADSDPYDDHGHGTHVSGTIGAVGNNGLGVAGVCWESSIMGLKAFDETGNGDVYGAIRAIEYAVANGARIINASWGLKERSRALREAIEAATAKGALVIAAAGNDRTDALFYPAAFDVCISVGATTELDARAPFTNFGRTLDISAPGASILSTLPDAAYGFQGGTSMAAPHVTGAAALIFASHPHFNAHEVRKILLNTTDDFETDQPMGVGRLNVGAAVQIDFPLPESDVQSPEAFVGSVEISGSAHGQDFVRWTLEIGKGPRPTNWLEIATGTTAITNGTFAANFDSTQLAEGEHVVRLSVFNTRNERAEARRPAHVRNVQIASPFPADIIKAGTAVAVHGSAFGRSRTFQIEWSEGLTPGQWQQAGITMRDAPAGSLQNTLLATWDTSKLPVGRAYALRIVATDSDGHRDEHIVHALYLEDRLKQPPIYVPAPSELPIDEWRSLKAADLEGDGLKEIVLVDPSAEAERAAHLIVYRANGELAWQRPLQMDPPFSDEPVIGDLDGDGSLEIVAGAGGQLFAFNAAGALLPGWPISIRGDRSGKALGDLDGDGALEIIAQSEDWSSSTPATVVTVYKKDGTQQARWTFQICTEDLNTPAIAPALGNMDADPEPEIVAIVGCSQIAVLDINSPNAALWISQSLPRISASPALGDVNGDGELDIVIGRDSKMTNGKLDHPGGIYVYSRRGELLSGWPVAVEDAFPHSVALADVDHDGRAEVAAISWPNGKVHLFNSNGFHLDGWPVAGHGTPNTSPILADVNGDSSVDVLAAIPGFWLSALLSSDLHELSGINAWDTRGRRLDLSSGPTETLPFESSGSLWAKAAPPVITDLDNDGQMELVAASILDRTYGPVGHRASRKQRSSIYIWQLDGIYSPASAPWPMHHQSAAHAANLPLVLRTNAVPRIRPLPSQTIPLLAQFDPIPLDEFVSDDSTEIEALLWNVETEALQATIDADRTLRVTAPAGWIGQEIVELTVRDASGGTARASVNYAVVPLGIQPAAPELVLAGLEDEIFEGDISLPLGVQVTHLGQSDKASFALEGTNLKITPTANVFGPVRAVYAVRNALGLTKVGSMRIDLAPVNDKPTPFSDQAVTDEDAVLTVDLLANDRDPEDDAITLIQVSEPKNGAVEMINAGLVRYTPARNFSGGDSFTYTVRDPSGLVADAVVSVNIRPVNDAPSTTNQFFVVNRNAKLVIPFPGIDPENDTITYHVTKAPQHGDVWVEPLLATYYPVKGFVGEDSFTYVATDGKGESAPATISIVITNQNNAPEVPRLVVATRQNQSLPLILQATDADEESLTFELTSQPTNGVVAGEPPFVTYTPNAGFLGEDTFRFAAIDPSGARGEGEVVVDVRTGNSAPVAGFTYFETRLNSPVRVLLRAQDPEGDPLTWIMKQPPQHGQLGGVAPDLIYVPEPNYQGPDRFTFIVSDGQVESGVGEVVLQVQPENIPPLASDQVIVAVRNETVAGEFNVTDRDGDAIRCVILKGPKGGWVTVNGSTFTYRATSAFKGSDSFTFRPWDGRRYGNIATVRVTEGAPEPTLPLQFTALALDGDRLNVTYTAPANVMVRLESSVDLQTWDLLSAALSTGTNTHQIVVRDAENALPAQTYFRLRR